MKNKNTIPAVEKTLEILEYLSSREEPVSQAEICRSAGVSATTGYRIVQSLIAHDWVRRERGNTYTLSSGMARTGMFFRKNAFLFDGAQGILDDLAAETQLTCKLSIRQWNDQLALLRAEPSLPFAVGGKNGVRFPVIEGSVGAALLSAESDEHLRELAGKTECDIPEKQDPDLLCRRVETVRKNGWIFNRGSNRWRVDALSMPILDSRREVAAALTLLGLQNDFTEENLPERVAALTRAVKRIEAEL